jgi:hypothetical protein
LRGTITLCSGLPLEHALGILPALDQPERERKKHALEENGDGNPEAQLLCSDSYCDLGQSVICFRRPGTLSSRLPAYKSLLRLPIAAKTISPAGRRSFRLYSESSSGFSYEGCRSFPTASAKAPLLNTECFFLCVLRVLCGNSLGRLPTADCSSHALFGNWL